MENPKKLVLKLTVPADASETVTDLLARESGLTKARVKDAMNKGAVWVRTGGKGLERFRRATREAHPGSRFELHYDEEILAVDPPKAELLADLGSYSVWRKPAGLMAQGTLFGDHASLLRQAELHFEPRRRVFLVHRLDREVEGVTLIAHTKEAAAKLSELFRTGKIEKRYRAEVLGDLSEMSGAQTIEIPLDEHPAMTRFEVESVDPARKTSLVNVTIETGRYHQIRRHFEAIGHPVLGDPRYGVGNKNTEGLRLWAVTVRFECPFVRKEVEYSILQPG